MNLTDRSSYFIYTIMPLKRVILGQINNSRQYSCELTPIQRAKIIRCIKAGLCNIKI